MTTYASELPTTRDFLAAKVHSLLIRERTKRVSTPVTAVLNATIRVVLHLAGFSLLTLAAFQWNIIAGMTVAGVSCFVLSTLLTHDVPATGEMEGRRAQDLRTGR